VLFGVVSWIAFAFPFKNMIHKVTRSKYEGKGKPKMFDSKSRYAKAETYVVKDARGRTVTVVAPPPPPDQVLLGIHLLKQGERLDLLAARYLNDPTGFWRIAEENNVMLPEALTEAREIEIPVKSS
jgi:hypothetical protein